MTHDVALYVLVLRVVLSNLVNLSTHVRSTGPIWSRRADEGEHICLLCVTASLPSDLKVSVNDSSDLFC